MILNEHPMGMWFKVYIIQSVLITIVSKFYDMTVLLFCAVQVDDYIEQLVFLDIAKIITYPTCRLWVNGEVRNLKISSAESSKSSVQD